MSYSGDIWYMRRISEELKKYACIWLISIYRSIRGLIRKVH